MYGGTFTPTFLRNAMPVLEVTEYDLGGRGEEGSSDSCEDTDTGVLYISPSQLTRHPCKPNLFTTKRTSSASLQNGNAVNSFVILRFLL